MTIYRKWNGLSRTKRRCTTPLHLMRGTREQTTIRVLRYNLYKATYGLTVAECDCGHHSGTVNHDLLLRNKYHKERKALEKAIGSSRATRAGKPLGTPKHVKLNT